MWKSTDGGVTFNEVTTRHGDNHDLWIDPNDNTRMIEGNDGGAHVSFNSGASWSTIYNQKTAQFYRIDVDNQLSLPGLRHAAGQHLDLGAERLGMGR